MAYAIHKKLSELKLPSSAACEALFPPAASLRKNEIKIHLAQIDEEIRALLSKVSEADCSLMKYINNKISELDAQKQQLHDKLLGETIAQSACKPFTITDYTAKWNQLSFADRQSVLDILVKVIRIADGQLTIEYHF